MSLDLMLAGWVSALVERARSSGARSTVREIPPIRLLFAGYNGARNTGSDVRVQEAIRQIRHVLGPDRVQATVLTQDHALTRGYFEGATQLKVPDLFPGFIAREVPKYDGVIACEGSMFKSTFANALSAFMIEALGIAGATGRLSVGYGAEAGEMDNVLEAMCRRYCQRSLVITRNQESRAILDALGVRTAPGTDTAWTFKPHDAAHGTAMLRQAGWNDRDPVLLVCPTNPFWWPVKASVAKGIARIATGAFADSHYRSVYFHKSGADVQRAYATYLDHLGSGLTAFLRDRRMFVALVAMEALDTDACERLSQKIGGAPIFSSRDHDMFALVSVLRCASMILSSRYHAIVTSMPASIPSAGIAMDERIRNLMADRGHDHLRIDCTDAALGDKIVEALRTLERDREAIQAGIARATMVHLERMAGMGQRLLEEVGAVYPEFSPPLRPTSWHGYLPLLDPLLAQMLEQYAS